MIIFCCFILITSYIMLTCIYCIIRSLTLENPKIIFVISIGCFQSTNIKNKTNFNDFYFYKKWLIIPVKIYNFNFITRVLYDHFIIILIPNYLLYIISTQIFQMTKLHNIYGHCFK